MDKKEVANRLFRKAKELYNRYPVPDGYPCCEMNEIHADIISSAKLMAESAMHLALKEGFENAKA